MTEQKTQSDKSEIKFLEGPQSRFAELKFIFIILWELIKCFRKLYYIGPCITFFGSSRFKEDHVYYEFTKRAAGEFAKLGFTIMTGGGLGLMEAANRGAKEVGGKSVGCNIKLPVDQMPNSYLDKWVEAKHFFIRKILLVKYSFAFVVMPGGFGTLDEYFEALTLIQTGKIKNFPIIIFNTQYHKALIEHIGLMKREGTINDADSELFMITDDIEQARLFIIEHSIKNYGLKPKFQRTPVPWI
ncbi:LOG family protein ORF6 in fasciation locus [compost metagenome]